MKNFLKYAAVIVALTLSASSVISQPLVFVAPQKAVHAGDALTAVSTDVGIYVKYVGTNAATATVAVDAATGDLTFLDSGAATDDFECPVSGDLGGVIDVSNAACNTFGEVVDTINGKCTGCLTGSWVAVLGATLRSDSSINMLDTLSATRAKLPEGLGLLKDTIVTLNMTAVLLPNSNGGRVEGIQNWMASPQATKLVERPFNDVSTTFLYGSALMTTTDDAANRINLYCVKEKYTNVGPASEVVQTLFSEAAGATTVAEVSDFTDSGGFTCDGGKLLYRVNGTTTLTVPTVIAAGYVRSRNQ